MTPSIGALTRLVLFLLCATVALAVQSRPKSDMVVLENGDRVTGEIKHMENGKLRYSTDSMGTVTIEWDGVCGLDSNFFFRVRTIDEKRYFGALGFSETPGYVQIVHAEGVEEYKVMDVVAVRPIESAGWERFDGVVGLGYSDIKASDSRTTNADLKITYEDEFSQNEFNARTVVSETNNETNKSSRAELARARLWQDTRYFNYYRAFWESIDELAVDSRTGLSFGIGHWIFDSNRTKLSLIGGLQVLTEEDSLGDTTESLEGLMSVNYRFWKFSDPEVELVTRLSVYPGITESGRLRSDGDIVLSWEVIEDLKLNLTAFGSYDNETNEDGDDYDYGITTGVSWEF